MASQQAPGGSQDIPPLQPGCKWEKARWRKKSRSKIVAPLHVAMVAIHPAGSGRTGVQLSFLKTCCACFNKCASFSRTCCADGCQGRVVALCCPDNAWRCLTTDKACVAAYLQSSSPSSLGRHSRISASMLSAPVCTYVCVETSNQCERALHKSKPGKVLTHILVMQHTAQHTHTRTH
eukprot:scaffold126180_cov20-Tisochrysis_lutea.AAC.4